MQDMPAEFYVPAFGALIAVIAAQTAAIKFLFSRVEKLNERIHSDASTVRAEEIKVITLNGEALRASTSALEKLSSNVRTQQRDRLRLNRQER